MRRDHADQLVLQPVFDLQQRRGHGHHRGLVGLPPADQFLELRAPRLDDSRRSPRPSTPSVSPIFFSRSICGASSSTRSMPVRT